MNEPPEASGNLRIAHFLKLLVDPEFFYATQEELAAECRVTDRTIREWRKKVDWDWVKAERRKQFGEKLSQLDLAMFKAGFKGDVAAAKYMAERYDDYTPTSKVLSEHSLEDGLIDDEIKYLSDRRIATASALADSARVDGEGRGPLAGPTSGEGEAKAG